MAIHDLSFLRDFSNCSRFSGTLNNRSFDIHVLRTTHQPSRLVKIKVFSKGQHCSANPATQSRTTRHDRLLFSRQFNDLLCHQPKAGARRFYEITVRHS
jgi:hypothetical protein